MDVCVRFFPFRSHRPLPYRTHSNLRSHDGAGNQQNHSFIALNFFMALFESNLILLCPVIFMLWHFIDVNEILWRNSFFLVPCHLQIRDLRLTFLLFGSKSCYYCEINTEMWFVIKSDFVFEPGNYSNACYGKLVTISGFAGCNLILIRCIKPTPEKMSTFLCIFVQTIC